MTEKMVPLMDPRVQRTLLKLEREGFVELLDDELGGLSVTRMPDVTYEVQEWWPDDCTQLVRRERMPFGQAIHEIRRWFYLLDRLDSL